MVFFSSKILHLYQKIPPELLTYYLLLITYYLLLQNPRQSTYSPKPYLGSASFWTEVLLQALPNT
ncbi:MAG: hypothetical protein F6K41_36885 [Symploca sp. SIO3E6]|nr:hypothetical protein [Caldora sp. SIO3E6]